MSRATCSSRARRSTSPWTAPPPPGSGSPWRAWTMCSTTCSASRIISTIYTQSNQYRVILEGAPAVQQSLKRPGQYLSAVERLDHQRAGSAFGHRPSAKALRPAGGQPFRPIPGDHHFLQSGAGRLAGRRRSPRSIAPRRISACPIRFIVAFQGAAAAFESSLTNELLLILAAIVTMYIVLGVLYESYIHPVTILSTLPSAGVGALLALDAVRRPTST